MLSCPLFSPQVSILKVLSVVNPDYANVVKFFEWFQHQGHTCLAFEMLDRSLYDMLLEQDWKPLSLNELRPIATQVCINVNMEKTLPLTMFVRILSHPGH